MKMYLPGLVTDLFGSTIDHPNLTGSLIFELDCLPCLRVLGRGKKGFVAERVKWVLLLCAPISFPSLQLLHKMLI